MDKENRQGGVVLGDEQQRLTPDIAHGDRAAEAVVSPTGDNPIGRVRFTRPIDGPVAPEMVDDQGRATPESGFGDVARVVTAPSVWEALQEGDAHPVHTGQSVARQEALERARAGDYAPPPLGSNDIDDSQEGEGG